MLRSEGWQVFVRRCALEWRGDGYFARMGQAVESSDPVATKVLHRVSIEIERAIQWPADRVKTLKGHTE